MKNSIRPILAIALFLASFGILFAETQVVSIQATDPFAIEKSTTTTASDTASFVISRSGNTTGALTVNLTASGNAVLTTDYTVAPSGATTSVVLADGKASVTVVVSPVDSSNLTLTYSKDTAKGDILYVVEVSTDLVNWQTGLVTEQVTATNGTVQTLKASVVMGADAKKFLQLKVSTN